MVADQAERPDRAAPVPAARPEEGRDHPEVVTIAADLDDTATTNSDAQLAVEQLKSPGVTLGHPAHARERLLPVLAARRSRVLPQAPPERLRVEHRGRRSASSPSLREGAQRAGGRDDRDPGRVRRHPAREPGWLRPRACGPATTPGTRRTPSRPQGRRASTSRSRARSAAGAPPSGSSPQAATNAGPNLNRRTFVTAMSKIKNFPGACRRIWTFGPNKFYGPTQYQVVEMHNNVPPSSQCMLKTNHKPQGTCWVVVQPFEAAALIIADASARPSQVIGRARSPRCASEDAEACPPRTGPAPRCADRGRARRRRRSALMERECAGAARRQDEEGEQDVERPRRRPP